ncbi:hypothetical protein BH09BAC6_BH09BAC6_28760 [soil metagenome]|jgi:hypothetical protein
MKTLSAIARQLLANLILVSFSFAQQMPGVSTINFSSKLLNEGRLFVT